MGEADHLAQQGGGGGAGVDESLSTKTKRRVRRPLHHASRGPPPPLRGGGRRKRSRSHGAIFVRARVLCPTMLLTASPLALFSGFPCARPRQQTKGKRTAERRVVNTRALRARGAPSGALASRRPTAALARGTAGPQGSAPGHASGDSPERSILWTANRGEDRAHLHGRYPRRKNQRNKLSPYREHLTCRS